MLGDALLGRLDDIGDDATALVADIKAALQVEPPKALERAAALYVWKKAWERALPASRHGGDRRSAAYRGTDQNEKISFSSVAASVIGVSERAVQLDVQLAEQLGPQDIRALWQSPIADNAAALRTVAALDRSGRDVLFLTWRDNPRLGFAAAMVSARLRASEDSDQAKYLQLLATWDRASSRARRRFMAEIGLADLGSITLERAISKGRAS